MISGARALQKAPEGGYLIDWIRSALGDPQDDGLVQVADSEVAVTVLRPEAVESDDIAITALDADGPIYAPSPAPDRVPSERHSPQTISYTAMHRFDACQYSYYVRYVLGLRDSSPVRGSDSVEFGVALHQALEGVIGGGDRGAVLGAVTRRHSLAQAQCERLKSAVDAFLASEVGVRALEGQQPRPRTGAASASGRHRSRGLDRSASRGTATRRWSSTTRQASRRSRVPLDSPATGCRPTAMHWVRFGPEPAR